MEGCESFLHIFSIEPVTDLLGAQSVSEFGSVDQKENFVWDGLEHSMDDKCVSLFVTDLVYPVSTLLQD